MPWCASVFIHCAGLLRILLVWELMSFSSEKFSSIFFLAFVFSVLLNILSTYICTHVVLYQWYHTIHAVLYNEYYFSDYIGYISFKIYQMI